MSDKTFKIVNGDLSDGYHTFDELYEHRNLLFINLWHGLFGAHWYADHYEGWDLLVVDSFVGQISYHVPKRFRPLYDHQEASDPSKYQFDGHTPSDVLDRLTKLAKI